MNVRRSINVINTTMKRIRKNLMLKKKKVKIMNDFFINKEALNAQTFKKDENDTKSILYRNVMNESFENDHRKQQNNDIARSQRKSFKFKMTNLL